MVSLPPLPRRIAALKRDHRGYPVPRFVEWMKDGRPCPRGEGEPDFRIADSRYRVEAFKRRLCWVCGEPLGRHQVYVIGPMCVVNRVTSEPASHRQCAEFAAAACPFLLRPRMKRLPSDDLPLTKEELSPGGVMLDRNPGCMALYETREAKPVHTDDGGWLIRLGPPDRIDWWAEGRTATRAEIMASIDGGLPFLQKLADADGQEAVRLLKRMTGEAFRLLPAA